MATSATTTQRRKGGGGAPRSLEGIVQVPENTIGLTSTNINGINSGGGGNISLAVHHGGTSTASSSTSPSPPVAVATVRRNKCGTSPFDENWLNMDCCGLFCALITYCLHMYGVYAVCMVLLPPWMSTTDDETGIRSLTFMGHFHRLGFTFVAVMASYAHFKAMTTDPGAVPPDAMPLSEQQQKNNQMIENGENGDDVSKPSRKGKKLCRRCNAYKPKRAHHCSVCGRCIIKMDHHCPWVNNCVGIGNHKYFLLFVFYTCISCIYSFSLVVTRFMGCMNKHGRLGPGQRHANCLDRPTQLLVILGLIVEAILFGMFTACMMIDQMSVVSSKLTHIDRLKSMNFEDDPLLSSPSTNSKHGNGASGEIDSLAGVVEVFGWSQRSGLVNGGTRFRPDWLSPFAKACFPASIHDEIMGFCRPCGFGGGRKNKNDTHGDSTTATTTELSAMSPKGKGTGRAVPTDSHMVRSVTEIV